MTDAILLKVRKLLAKAEDPAATEEESEVYTAKATDLIATYGIDRALLAQTDPSSDIVGDRVIVLDAPYARDKAGLLAAVAVPLRCRVVQRTRYVEQGKEISMHLFGFESDLTRVELLFTSLLLQATSIMIRTTVPWGEGGAAFRRSWLVGFARAVGQRLEEAERRAERQAQEAADAGSSATADASGRPSVALVLADRGDDVAEAVNREYPRLSRGQSRRLSGSGAGRGYRAGQEADLGGGSHLGGRARPRIAG